MNQAGKIVFGAVVFLLLSFHCARAQQPTAMLSGTVADSNGKLAANVRVSVRNVSSGESSDTQTNSSGVYSFQNLAAGEYEVSALLDATTASEKVTLTAGAPQNVNLSLAQNLPNAPSSNPNAPSLSDLGFSPTETQANAREQALLDKRTHMLKIHQRMGLITTIPMIATVITSFNAGGKNEGSASRDLHVALGSVTGDLYGITAYYAIRAPRIKGTETRGPIKVHKILAWIHGPGMIATPILGAMAFNQKNNGEKVHGIASAHGPVAIVTAGAFGAALLAVSVKF